jgi:hypothetical protein
MSTSLRILEQVPYIPSNVQLEPEYNGLGNLSMPRDCYIHRAGIRAQPVQLAASPYIPDTIEDRQLLKVFESIPDRTVDFGLFRRRVRAGKEITQAATTTSLGKTNRELRAYYDQCTNPSVGYYLFASRVRKLGWSQESAVSTPKQTGRVEKPLTAYFEANKHLAKVDYLTFYTRVAKLGWSKEDALCRLIDPRYNRKCDIRVAYESASTPPAVSFITAYQRIKKLKWDIERAFFEPVR